jgi:predicted Holliday junction resolvase-like endonuclease
MNLTLQIIFILIVLFLTCFYFYALYSYLKLSMLSNDLEIDISQLKEFRDSLVLETKTLKAEMASKIMENEKMQELLLDLAEKSDNSLFIKVTVVLTFLALIGLVFYVQSLSVHASEKVVTETTYNSIDMVSFAQYRSANSIQALETKIQSSNYAICELVTRCKENMDLISSLNSQIDDLTLSATKLEEIYKISEAALLLSGPSSSGF